MANMNQKDMAEPLIKHHSDSSNNYEKDQISNMNHHGVTNKNKSKMETHEIQDTHLPISSNQLDSKMVDDILIDIKAMLKDSQEPPFPSERCIYMVPHTIRKLKKDAYTPKVVSIGPFHYGNPKLINMERNKQIVFKRFINGRDEKRLDDLIRFVKSLERRVRACYAEKIKLSRKKLVKVMLVDAIFIIDFFCGPYNGSYPENPWFMTNITGDLILLENQLPFFFLEELFNREFLPYRLLHGQHDSFLELTFKFFQSYNSQPLKSNNLNISIKHFTDLLRTFKLPERQIPIEGGCEDLLFSASELHEAGLKFKVSSSKCLLDLDFTHSFLKSVLNIPEIVVEDGTETLFRNLVALELFLYPFDSYITHYIFILDNLINSSKDVDILVHEKIISNLLGNTNDVAKLFNGLGTEIVQVNSNRDYKDICKKLNDFYKSPFHNTVATVKRNYFKTPWQIVLSIAGLVLLVLGTVQTIFSIIK